MRNYFAIAFVVSSLTLAACVEATTEEDEIADPAAGKGDSETDCADDDSNPKDCAQNLWFGETASVDVGGEAVISPRGVTYFRVDVVPESPLTIEYRHELPGRTVAMTFYRRTAAGTYRSVKRVTATSPMIARYSGTPTASRYLIKVQGSAAVAPGITATLSNGVTSPVYAIERTWLTLRCGAGANNTCAAPRVCQATTESIEEKIEDELLERLQTDASVQVLVALKEDVQTGGILSEDAAIRDETIAAYRDAAAASQVCFRDAATPLGATVDPEVFWLDNSLSLTVTGTAAEKTAIINAIASRTDVLYLEDNFGGPPP